MTPRTDPPGPCFVYAIMVAILAVCFAGFAGFGLAAWQNEEFRAGIISTCLPVGIILACLVAVALGVRSFGKR